MVQEAKSPVKNLIRQRCVEGFNPGVKGLIYLTCVLHLRGFITQDFIAHSATEGYYILKLLFQKLHLKFRPYASTSMICLNG
jgi:hypothetical protein